MTIEGTNNSRTLGPPILMSLSSHSSFQEFSTITPETDEASVLDHISKIIPYLDPYAHIYQAFDAFQRSMQMDQAEIYVQIRKKLLLGTIFTLGYPGINIDPEKALEFFQAAVHLYEENPRHSIRIPYLIVETKGMIGRLYVSLSGQNEAFILPASTYLRGSFSEGSHIAALTIVELFQAGKGGDYYIDHLLGEALSRRQFFDFLSFVAETRIANVSDEAFAYAKSYLETIFEKNDFLNEEAFTACLNSQMEVMKSRRETKRIEELSEMALYYRTYMLERGAWRPLFSPLETPHPEADTPTLSPDSSPSEPKSQKTKWPYIKATVGQKTAQEQRKAREAVQKEWLRQRVDKKREIFEEDRRILEEKFGISPESFRSRSLFWEITRKKAATLKKTPQERDELIYRRDNCIRYCDKHKLWESEI
jgi:hypothetical protein